ncbi:imidazolonepropionase [Aureibaculum sp. 2210JD6-5]|uniref:imidazolonepropionase n=1 Tax=Aureibaculum sp. 2210JD6-5 TaxID=3103957 RepID=UPI002AAE603E|nr:imidazolonepropionase [Aureibaculum sp. 2210JD6-5]MDY7393929.1 imidazolonepropionase [Aureibaculum sp. 2210JD6-5]
MPTLITNIKELLQIRESSVSMVSGAEMKILPTLKNAYVIVENDTIKDFGKMEDLNGIVVNEVIDAKGKMVLPAWCDSHTHIVYAGNREGEFVDRINGLTYEEIAAKGGGILNSAKKLQETNEEELYKQSAKRLEEIIALGTGAVEIKSGYGLTVEAELKMLRVIKKLAENYSITIKATFLGAHAFPDEYKNNKEVYIDLIINQMLPKIANENLAEFIDVFCEKSYFSVAQTEKILEAAKKYGLTPKIHVNQFNSIGGVQIGVKYNALSVDHLEVMTPQDLEALKNTKTMPVALPSCSFFLGIPYTPARQIVDSGLPLALATDYNPGSTPSGNMNFVISTACIKMKMTPEEAINAATINGAYAMNLSKTHGSITKGKKANLIITKEIPSYGFLPYAFGSNLIKKVIINGKII